MAVTPVDLAAPTTLRRRDSTATVVWRFVRKKPLGAAGGVLMLIMLVTTLLANVLETHDPIATNASATLAKPSDEHWLGTEHLGRDIFSRIVHWARNPLHLGICSTMLRSGLSIIIALLYTYDA